MKLPKEFCQKYQKLMGDHAEAFLKSFDREPTQGFRINPLKAHTPIEEKLDDPIPWAKWGYYGKVRGRTVDHQSGAVYDQEPSAMYVGTVVDPKPGEKVLDLCAAPGSKTTYLASLMNNQGLLVANEIIPKRAKVLASNLERFGVTNALTLNEPPHKMTKSFKRYFDKILVDAPCSGEGMFRKNPEAIKYCSLDYPKKCAERQRKILNQAVKMLKPGGTLVYSTCTFAPEEDEQVIAWLLDNYDFKTVPVKKYPGMLGGQPQWANHNPELKNAVRIFPNRVKGEGHFIAKLQKGTQGSPKKIKTQRSNVPHRDRDLWNQFAKKDLVDFQPKNLIEFGRQLYAYNPDIPNLKKLQVVSPGLHLGTLKKNRFEPSYALALALHPDQVKHHVTISIDEWKKYVHGDTLPVDPKLPKGWYQLICWKQPIAFGKVVQGTIKNFFPKGLRFLVR